MKRTWMIVAVVTAVALGAFVAGALIAPRVPLLAGMPGAPGLGAEGRGPAGGPFAQLSAPERAKVEGMTEDERRAYLQDKMGDRALGGPGGRGGMTVEGTVLEAGAESLVIKTDDGGSRTVYLDGETVVGYAAGAEQTAPAVGDSVIAATQPEGDNVLSATMLVVR